MVDRVLLALTSAPEGGPACLVDGGEHRSPLERLVAQLDGPGRVVVVTWSAWAGPLRSALPDAVGVLSIDSHPQALRALLDVGSDELVIAHAHLAANDLALGRLADGAASGTAAIVGPWDLPGPSVDDGATGSPVRVTRGRIVAAASAFHTVEHPTGRCLGALRIAAGDRRAVGVAVGELADLLAGTPPTNPAVADPGASQVEPTDDLVELVLVAAVRGGVVVAATGLPRGSVWRHVRTSEQYADAVGDIAALDEEKQRLDASVKSDDGFFTTFLVSSYSRYWARWAARHGFTPNQVTSVSMVVGIAAAVAFATGAWWGMLLGAVLLQLAFTLDCVDGQLARYTRRFTVLGAWLDSVFDRGKEYVVYAGLAVGGVRAGDEGGIWLLAGAALALQTFRHTLDLGYAEQQAAEVDAAVRQSLDEVDDAGPSFWEATPAGSTAAATPVQDAAAATPARDAVAGPRPGLPRRAIVQLRRAEAVPALRWAKRIVVLPIGERFALISLVAVLAGPRAVFVALLVWGGIATAYTAGGRVVRSIA